MQNMKFIQAPGDYRMKIVNVVCKETINGALGIELHAFTEVQGEEQKAVGTIYISNTIFQSGKNAGKTLAEVNGELLIKLGVPSGDGDYPNLAEVEQLIGKECNFVMDWDRKNPALLVVQFINASGAEVVSPAEAAGIFSKIVGSAAAPKAQEVIQPSGVRFQPVSEADVAKMINPQEEVPW